MADNAIAKNPHILLVSKELWSPDCHREQLVMAGLNILQIHDPIDTLKVVSTQSIDLVLLHISADEIIDLGLPQILRKVSALEYLPIVVIADELPQDKRCEYLDNGVDEVINGNASGPEFVARVRALLRIRHLHNQLALSRQALQQSLDRERQLLAKLQQDNAQLQDMCTIDPLTHTKNVRSFRDILQHEFKQAVRYGHALSMLMLDVDHFKQVNDKFGHPCGDYVLKEVAVILKKAVRDSDVVARTGGEEFSLILPKAGPAQAEKLAQRIRKEVRKRRFSVFGKEIHVTISIGTASYPADAEIVEPAMLVYLADQALLEAKETGRNRVVALREMPMETRQRLHREYRKSRSDLAKCSPEVDAKMLGDWVDWDVLQKAE